MSRGPALLALALALAACCCCQRTCAAASECRFTEADGSVSVFAPGKFTPPAKGGSSAPANCPDPFAVPPGSDFPFWLGSATAAYQVEGAAGGGGRSPSIWDVFSKTPGKVYQGETGDVAVDFYNKYPADVALMQQLGLRNFRLSLSWSRLLPNGTGELNQEGVDFYNQLIDALKEACIEPHVTLYHWDLPQALEDEYGGWLSPQVVDDFTAYAKQAFELFGDRVKHWYTLNEPETYCNLGYGNGVHAPGRCSDHTICAEGDSTTEVPLCAYHSVLAHANAVKAFRELVPNGTISITNAIGWTEPLTDSPEDKAAAERIQAYSGGWFLDPLYTGDWGDLRKQLTGDALPAFTPEQRALLLANQQDHIALQHYTGAYAADAPGVPPFNATQGTANAEGVELPQADSPWLRPFPVALRHLLVWLHERYDGAPIIITENGVSAPGENDKPADELICDQFRLSYYQQYVGNATLAKEQDGVDLRGYMAWSLLDNFEWADGYSKHFGINYVDLKSPSLDRYIKASALWLSRHFGVSPGGGSGGDAGAPA